jgi:acyl-CoA synthetase (AMP-forming)/AMP-acid ligase II
VTRPTESVSAAVRRWADRDPDRPSVAFHRGDTVPHRLSYAELAGRSSAWARRFQDHGLRSGDTVVILAPSDPEFVAAFLGAQEAGLLPVPCPPPEPLEGGRRVGQRFSEILGRCRARGLASPVSGVLPSTLVSDLASDRVVVMEGPAGSASDPLETTPQPFAYCQFTSGSGGVVKGVLLTHDNVRANVEAMADAYGLTPDDVFVTWLPLFHDMGLVAYVLMPLLLGLPTHFMTPLEFLSRPIAWPRLMSRVGASMASAPNLAYGLCARRATEEDLVGLDLSRWRIACNGSEPVTHAAVEAFCRRFAACGFRASAMLPAYGLAEDTLCATARRPGEGVRFDEVSREALEVEGFARPAPMGPLVASVGRPLAGHEIAVVDGDGLPRPPRHVGEVAIRGASVMAGYLEDTSGEVALQPDGWLLTGDLGYLAEGELYLVGRKKDLIIRAGRNYYPQDLEDAAMRVEGVRRVAAFAVPTPQLEQVVLAIEPRSDVETDPAALTAALRQTVFAATRLVPDEILLLPRNALPLTSSGKVMRPEARRLYLEGRWTKR